MSDIAQRPEREVRGQSHPATVLMNPQSVQGDASSGALLGLQRQVHAESRQGAALDQEAADPVSVGARAALYAAEGSVLPTCARHAEHAGFRIVTMVYEDVPDVGFAGTRLNALVDRLGGGEVEVIVADAGAGRVVTITAVSTEDLARLGRSAEPIKALFTELSAMAIPVHSGVGGVINPLEGVVRSLMSRSLYDERSERARRSHRKPCQEVTA